MATELIIKFHDSNDADMFLRGLEHGHVDGWLIRQLGDRVEVIGETSTPD